MATPIPVKDKDILVRKWPVVEHKLIIYKHTELVHRSDTHRGSSTLGSRLLGITLRVQTFVVISGVVERIWQWGLPSKHYLLNSLATTITQRIPMRLFS
jgi:hypothetical protein